MATIKAFTDIEQSKKLAKILPITSIDFAWCIFSNGSTKLLRMDDWEVSENAKSNVEIIPCWSLASLLSVLPDYTLQTNTDGTVFVVCDSKKPMISDSFSNPVDACVTMIEKLHELKRL